MTAQPLRVNRPQLEAICQNDFDTLRQFELLFDLVNTLSLGVSPPAWPGATFTGPLLIQYGIEGGPGLQIEASASDGDFFNLVNFNGNTVIRARTDANEDAEFSVLSSTGVLYFDVTSSGLTSTLDVTLSSTTDSTSSTTGAVVTAGGLGVAKNVNIGENLTVTEDVKFGSYLKHGNETISTDSTISKSKAYVDSTGITVTMPLIEEDGQEVTVISENTSGTFTLRGSGSETVEGSASVTVYGGEVWVFGSNGSNWKVAG